MFSRQSKIAKSVNGQSHLNGEVIGEFKMKINMNSTGDIDIDVNNCQPSTSKTVNLPVRRAKMIRIEKSNDSSDQDEEDSNYVSKPKVSSTYNGRRQLQSSEEENENSDLNNGIGEDNGTESEINNDENNDEIEENSDDSNERTDDKEEEDKSEESENSNEYSENESKLNKRNSQNSSQKTVKVIYPKRRESSETDSTQVKGNCVVANQVSNNTRHKPECNSSEGRLRTRLNNKGKYPLRQTAKKCLAELSSDESSGAHYKTRRASRRFQNGFSKYIENSDESDGLSEDENADECEGEKDTDSDSYSPPRVQVRGRGCKRRRSSDSTADWNSSGQGIYQRLRKSGSSQKSTRSNGQRRGRSRLAKQSIRNNSESEISLQSDNSDSDVKPAISVSSRGRVRKLTPRARALLRD